MPLYRNNNAALRFPVKANAYLFGNASVSTSATLGNGSLRLTPLYLAVPVTVTAIGAEFTVAGDAASLFRMSIYADDGTFYPGALTLDGGSISTGSGNAGTVSTGGTPGVYMNTGISATTLAAGAYWLGGAVQGVTGTQPTMRTGYFMPDMMAALTTVPSAGSNNVGYTQASVTGAPPSNFATFASASSAGSVPRIVIKIA